MIFEVEGAAEKILLVELVAGQDFVARDARNDRRGAAAHASRERNFVVDPQVETEAARGSARFAVFTATL